MSAQILLNKAGSSIIATLNRPNVLNALTFEMCNEMNKLLDSNDYSVVIVKGSGDKAFCAGGDVKACYQSLIDNPNLVCNGKPGVVNSDFFREEYRMNYRIGTSKIPQVSLWKGIVMGGGVGISIHGKYRVATDNTLFAMPETAIGLFPDVGGTYWLPKLPNNYGNYIGLTGVRLHSYDLLHSGIATHFVKQTLLPDLEAALANVGPLSLAHAKVQEILDDFSSRSAKPDPSKSILHKLDSAISNSFDSSSGGNSIESIIERLKNLQVSSAASSFEREWSAKTLAEITKASPTSLKVTLEAWKRGKGASLKDCLVMEYRLMMRLQASNDFKEGIRALLVDKDNSPKWAPASLSLVSDSAVATYFDSLNPYDLSLS